MERACCPFSIHWTDGETDPHLYFFSGHDQMGVSGYPLLHRKQWVLQLGSPEKLTGGSDRSVGVKGALLFWETSKSNEFSSTYKFKFLNKAE